MHTPRYILRLFTTFISRFKGIIFVGVILGILGFLAVSFILPSISRRTTRIVGMTGRYHPDDLPFEVLDLIGEGLTNTNNKGEVSPSLAQSWEQSEEGKVWTFYLADDKYWQDGKPVTSESINYSFSDVQIEYPNEKTIVFKLESPFSPFPVIVSKTTFKKGLLGTGEWKVEKLSLAGSYVEKIILKDGSGNRQVIKFYPTEERAVTAFKLGEVDEIYDLNSNEYFKDWNTLNISGEVNYSRFVAIFFNTERPDDPEKNNPLSVKEIRQALSYAVNKQDFTGPRAISPISPNSWAFNPQVKNYEYDIDRAKELIADSSLSEIELVTSPLLLSDAEKVASYWQELGVKTNVQVSSIFPSEYQAYLVMYDIPKDPDQYATWHSTQAGTNISHYNSPRIDKLLEDGRLELDKTEREKIYLDFQRFLLEDAPALFLYHPISYNVTRK